MSQGNNCSRGEDLLSAILIEMTEPVEEILGGPRIEALTKAVPQYASSSLAKSSSLSRWRNYSLPPVLRLKAPFPDSPGWFTWPNNFSHKHKPRSLADKQLIQNVTRPSSAPRSRGDFKSRQKVTVPRSQRMPRSTSRENNFRDQRIGVPPRYPDHKTNDRVLLNKTSVGHQRSNYPAKSALLTRTEKGMYSNTSKQDAEELLLKSTRKQEVTNAHKNGSRPLEGELQAKRRLLEMSFKASRARCISLYSIEEYDDDYEQEAKRAFKLCFDWALVMESELRFSEQRLRRMPAENMMLQKRDILKHYDYITHGFADRIIKELQGIGRRQTASFYRQGLQKVYLRRLALQKLWDRDMKIRTAEAHQTIVDAAEASALRAGKGTIDREISIRISMDKLVLLKRIVLEHELLGDVVEGIVSDLGNSHEEAGHECRIQ